MLSAHDKAGLTLSQHGGVLLLSIVLSVVLHFGLLFCFKGALLQSVTGSTKTPSEDRIKPRPPVQVKLVERTEDPTHAKAKLEIDGEPTAKKAEPKITKDDAQAVRLQSPALPNLVQDAATEVKPESPKFTTQHHDMLKVPDTPFTQQTNPEPRWILPVDSNLFNEPLLGDICISDELAEKLEPTPVLPLNDGLYSFKPSTEGLLGGAGEGLPQPEPLTISAPAPELAAPEEIFQALAENHRVIKIDDRLTAKLAVDHAADGIYYRLTINRKNEQELPILGKDVLFVQDASGSISGRRLRACREALKSALYNTLRVGDRFSVLAFRNKNYTFSKTWCDFSSDSIERATEFIDTLDARGGTNLFNLLKSIRSFPAEGNRPKLVIIVTDGLATIGLTETTRIIGEFTRINGGISSVYTFGLDEGTSPYFLDMLAYTNRGENTMAKGKLTTLGKELSHVFSSIRNPIMKDPRFRFTPASEVHPSKFTHLYADRPLVLYGRAPKGSKRILCQMQGETQTRPYDAIFTLDLSKPTLSKSSLRKSWAEYAMFDMLAEYASNPSKELLARIHRHSATYQVRDPYGK